MTSVFERSFLLNSIPNYIMYFSTINLSTISKLLLNGFINNAVENWTDFKPPSLIVRQHFQKAPHQKSISSNISSTTRLFRSLAAGKKNIVWQSRSYSRKRSKWWGEEGCWSINFVRLVWVRGYSGTALKFAPRSYC